LISRTSGSAGSYRGREAGRERRASERANTTSRPYISHQTFSRRTSNCRHATSRHVSSRHITEHRVQSKPQSTHTHTHTHCATLSHPRAHARPNVQQAPAVDAFMQALVSYPQKGIPLRVAPAKAQVKSRQGIASYRIVVPRGIVSSRVKSQRQTCHAPTSANILPTGSEAEPNSLICRSCRHPRHSRSRRKCNQQFRSQASS
jgi:hypothetical protein